MNTLGIIFAAFFGFLLHANVGHAQTADQSPTSHGTATVPNENVGTKNEFLIRLGNESNPVDGLFGPFTYGVRGMHAFENEFQVEAGYMRLHEPSMQMVNSFLDEAQFTLRFPKQQSILFGATLWQNRMIDMYTNVAGIEVTRVDRVSTTFGLYSGTATKNDSKGNFRGAQLAATGTLGIFELTASGFLGKIDEGSYRKLALEGAVDLKEHVHVPATVTLAIEDRYFKFGLEGPESAPADEFIFVTGLEWRFE